MTVMKKAHFAKAAALGVTFVFGYSAMFGTPVSAEVIDEPIQTVEEGATQAPLSDPLISIEKESENKITIQGAKDYDYSSEVLTPVPVDEEGPLMTIEEGPTLQPLSDPLISIEKESENKITIQSAKDYDYSSEVLTPVPVDEEGPLMTIEEGPTLQPLSDPLISTEKELKNTIIIKSAKDYDDSLEELIPVAIKQRDWRSLYLTFRRIFG